MARVESISVYKFHDGKFEKIHSVDASNSIGILYSLVTLHLGFEFNSDEDEIMGLAPYGDPARFRKFFEETVQLRPDGSIRIPMLKLNQQLRRESKTIRLRAHGLIGTYSRAALHAESITIRS